MKIIELGNLDDSAQFVLQSTVLMRTAKPSLEAACRALAIARSVASEGSVTPPIGLLFDLAAIATGQDSALSDADVCFEHALFRRYDDYVLGRIYGDAMLQRGGFAIERYKGDDQVQALAYLAERVVERAALPGVMLNPAVFKSLDPKSLEARLSQTWEQLLRDGIGETTKSLYDLACNQMRVVGPLLGVEDVFELEHQLALRPLSERVALRYAWQASEFFCAALPKDRPPMRRDGRQVATRIEDEDLYPVGGYASLSNRGSMESLLHSQLAYMEDHESPDLFDVKLLRNELLFFARDENTFYRRRKTIVVQFDPTLELARIKDASLPWQRITLICGAVLAAFRTLDGWLSDHALQWLLVFPQRVEDEKGLLAEEEELLQVAFQDAIENLRVVIRRLDDAELEALTGQLHKRSELHAIRISSAMLEPANWLDNSDTSASVRIPGERPQLTVNGQIAVIDDSPEQAWRNTVSQLLLSLL